jgi:hypothetical protein
MSLLLLLLRLSLQELPLLLLLLLLLLILGLYSSALLVRHTKFTKVSGTNSKTYK